MATTQHQPGLIAILRGLTPTDAPEIGDALVDAGIRCLEVPLNSPDPFASIELLADRLGDDVLVGAGTVIELADVDRVRDVGGRLIVAPSTDPAVIARTIDLGLTSCPGVATPTDVFTALRAGANSLKIFPAETVGIPGMRAWSAVVPDGTRFLPVGGVDAATYPDWLAAGAAGAGIGSALFTPGRRAEEVRQLASELVSIHHNHHP
ncbi:MAG: 2-dehydro-3-deoxy-6-phosphogalactonate aldolase [Brachybacterium sp.]|nr:2-dehydro-3-deoxy-6-phosphogalactonate aldolase [Brachybacterium sp.]